MTRLNRTKNFREKIEREWKLTPMRPRLTGKLGRRRWSLLCPEDKVIVISKVKENFIIQKYREYLAAYRIQQLWRKSNKAKKIEMGY